jgi:hypothetical protein
MDLLIGMWDGEVRNPHALDQYTHVGYDDHRCMRIETMWLRTQESEDICKLNSIS